MPDMLLIAIAFISMLAIEICLLSRMPNCYRFSKKTLYVWVCVFFATSIWFLVGYFIPWTPYKVEFLKVITTHRNDGMLVQSLDGEPVGYGLGSEAHENTHYSVFYPEGTVFKKSSYSPWQTGIYWTRHVHYEIIMPKQ